MLGEDDPLFANWDQDATAVAERLRRPGPRCRGAGELAAAAELVAATYDGIRGDQWQRPRHGAATARVFTVETPRLATTCTTWSTTCTTSRHDHAAMTVAAYSDSAAALRRRHRRRCRTRCSGSSTRFAATLGAGARVLEIGSGPGRDALALEAAGLAVRRTDVTPGFVELLRAQGHRGRPARPAHRRPADPADPRQYDAVWANACLLHVAREDLPVVLSRLAAATRPGGLLQLSPQGGRRRALVDPRPRRRPAALHLLARGAAARRPRRGRLVGARRSTTTTGMRGESWLEVLAERRA